MIGLTMPSQVHFKLALFGAAAAAASAGAGYVNIEGGGSSYELQAGAVPGILSSDSHVFSANDAEVLTATLEDDGIDTEGRLSFLLATTDAGLTIVGLFDGIQSGNPSGNIDSILGFSSTTGQGTDWFAGGDKGSQVDWYDLGNGNQLVTALLQWEHGQSAAGVAWGDIESATTGTVNMYDLGLGELGGEPIQFVTHQAGSWEVAGTAAFSVVGQYAFAYQFVPSPGALGLLAVAGMFTRRRRR